MPNLVILVAMDKKNGIGKNNKLPWNVPEDMQHFKDTSTGHAVIMGRKTFESMNSKPLKNRRCIILTRDIYAGKEGVTVAHSMEEALEMVGEELAFVIGGAEIYEAAMPYVNKMIVTNIEDFYACDRHFPDIDRSVWFLDNKQHSRYSTNGDVMFNITTWRRLKEV